MTTTARPRSCLTIGELSDYWTADLEQAEVEGLEAHVFECADCARRLAESERLRRRVGETVRAGAFQAFVTDDVLNRLAREGVRLRSYTLSPGDQVQCAVWADDELLVARLRADFTGVSSVSALMQLETGEEVDRVTDAPVRAGSAELLLAMSAEIVRRSPESPMRFTLRAGPDAASGSVLAEYVFDHRGAHDRSAPQTG